MGVLYNLKSGLIIRLMINPTDLGGIAHDNRLNAMVSGLTPLAQIDQSSEAFAGVHEMVTKLL